MLWQLLKRHRRKIFLLTLLGGGGYAAVRYVGGKLSKMLDEQDRMMNEWKKQLYYEHNRDMSLKTSTDIFTQVMLNINRAFPCESILEKLQSTSDSAEKRRLWDELKIECFARLFTFAYSSGFVLALTELVVSAFSGRLFCQSQLQHASPGDSSSRTAAGGVSATSKSSHAESTQEKMTLLSRDVQLACLDVIRYTTEAGMAQLIEDVRKATHAILSRIPLQQNLDINDLIWYCSEIRHQIEKRRYSTSDHHHHHPLLKYVRSPTLTRRRSTQSLPPTTTASTYSFSNAVSTARAFFSTERAAPPPIFNLQQQFEMECVEMIESDGFQRVLTQIIDQSFSNIYDDFAREIAKVPNTASMTTTDNHSMNPLITVEQQLPLAKIIPMSNNIYSKFSMHHQQVVLHFQSLACRPELHEYTKYAYELFSNESPQSPTRTAYSFLPFISPASAESIQSNVTSLLRSLMPT